MQLKLQEIRGLKTETSVASWLQSNLRSCRRSELAMISSNDMLELSCHFRVKVPLTHGDFFLKYPRPAEWFYVVLNYLGPEDGEGIRVYINGTLVGGESEIFSNEYTSGDGRLVVGRYFTDEDRTYASVQVDELIFFNQALSSEEVIILSNLD